MVLKRFLLSALVATSLSSSAFSASNGPIKSITLSSGGLSEIVRQARVENDGIISIEVPLEQVDDILKSLVVNDREGAVKDISLAGLVPIEETFKTLPFEADQLGKIPALLSRLQGIEVTVSSSGKTLTGKVMGVDARHTEKEGEAYLLSLLTDHGIKSLEISDDIELAILDDAMRSKIQEAITVAGKGINDGSRLISIRMTGRTERDITLTYVVPAPVWKTSYRLVLGEQNKARLQAWAILENATGEDWKNVTISLTSGEPVTLKQRLHQRIWRDREELQVSTRDDTSRLALSRMEQRTQAAAPSMMAYEADVAGSGFTVAPAAETVNSLEADVVTSFNLAGLYDLPNGDTLSTPIVDAEIEAEMVSLFKSYSGLQHPVASVVLKNSTNSSLPPGIMTVFRSDEGYIGDSRLDGLHKEATLSASFAVDKKVTVKEDTKHNQEIIGIKVVDGILTSESKTRNTSIYEITGAADADRVVVVEHPKQVGGQFSSEALDRETPNSYLLKVAVDKGGSARITAVHETIDTQSYGLVDLQPDMLISLSQTALDKDVMGKLRELSEARQKQMEAEATLQSIQEEMRHLEARQERIRKNLAAVPDSSDLQASYVTDLSSTEDQIKKLEEDHAKATDEANIFGRRVGDLIRTF